MNAAQARMRFPVLAFTGDGDVWCIPGLDIMTRCGGRTLKDGLQRDMEVVDSRWRRWKVRDVRRTGYVSALNLLLSPLFGGPEHRIEHDLVPLEPVALEEVRSRVLAYMKANPDYFLEYDEKELRATFRSVERARTVAGFESALGLDDFRSY
jgi:hypothetical protein